MEPGVRAISGVERGDLRPGEPPAAANIPGRDLAMPERPVTCPPGGSFLYSSICEGFRYFLSCMRSVSCDSGPRTPPSANPKLSRLDEIIS